jgi:hypothetical protein
MDIYKNKTIEWFNNGIRNFDDKKINSEDELEKLLCFYKRDEHLILFKIEENNQNVLISFSFATMLGCGNRLIGVNLLTNEVKLY